MNGSLLFYSPYEAHIMMQKNPVALGRGTGPVSHFTN